jgi:hypothetical protein
MVNSNLTMLINNIFDNNIHSNDVNQIISIIQTKRIEPTQQNIQQIYQDIIKKKIITIITPTLIENGKTEPINYGLNDTIKYVIKYPAITSQQIIDKYFERTFIRIEEFKQIIKDIIESQIKKMHRGNTKTINDDILNIITEEYINRQTLDNDEYIFKYYLALNDDLIDIDPRPNIKKPVPQIRSDTPITTPVSQIKSESSITKLMSQIRSNSPMKKSSTNKVQISHRPNNTYPAYYNEDEEDSNIDTVEYDFDINHSRLRFISDSDYEELEPNIIRYIELECINIFSTIGCNETPEDRRIRHKNHPYIIQHYHIYSTIDQINKFSAIRTNKNHQIFHNLPIKYDLINTRGNGYCLLNSFFIFSTITFGASRLTSLYNQLSEFRQQYLLPQRLDIQQSKKKTIHNFIKGIRALAHHFINDNQDYNDEMKSELHKAINDTNIPDTQFICNEFVNIANCAIINLIVDNEFNITGTPYCKNPDYPINIDTEYCVVIQRNNIHYYLLLPQNNTKHNRKILYDYYKTLCR